MSIEDGCVNNSKEDMKVVAPKINGKVIHYIWYICMCIWKQCICCCLTRVDQETCRDFVLPLARTLTPGMFKSQLDISIITVAVTCMCLAVAVVALCLYV